MVELYLEDMPRIELRTRNTTYWLSFQ